LEKNFPKIFLKNLENLDAGYALETTSQHNNADHATIHKLQHANTCIKHDRSFNETIPLIFTA